MPLYIKDNETADLVAQLAAKRGITKSQAVKISVQAELERSNAAPTIHDKLQQFWLRNPVPEPTGEVADKAFFDDLSGE